MKLKITFFFSLLSLIQFAQNSFFCLSDQMEKEIIISTPSIKEIQKKQEIFIASKQNENKSGEQIYIIPVVFHILHQNGVENISDAQVLSAMEVLNEDFRKKSADTSKILSVFKSIAADCNIEFRLATLDPNGNPSTGIDRIESAETNSGDDGSKLNIWDRGMYLNIWVTKIVAKNANAGAYTYRPATVSGTPSKDGVIIKYSFLGKTGAGSELYCHTLSHEIGHWIDLYHTWGTTGNPGASSNCNQDDLVSDTPNTIGWTTCNTSGSTCGVLDNVQNFMEYSLCQYMFTQGQKVRIRAALESATADRNNIWTKSNLILTGTYDATLVNNIEEKKVKLSISPNPVTSLSTISFYLENPSTISITIYDAMGKKIREEGSFNLKEGEQSFVLKKENIEMGIYFLKLYLNEKQIIAKPFLIK